MFTHTPTISLETIGMSRTAFDNQNKKKQTTIQPEFAKVKQIFSIWK